MKTYAGKNTYIESKVSKNIALLYIAKPYIDKHLLLSLHHFYIPILTTETLHGEVQSGQTLKKYTVNRNNFFFYNSFEQT